MNPESASALLELIALLQSTILTQSKAIFKLQEALAQARAPGATQLGPGTNN